MKKYKKENRNTGKTLLNIEHPVQFSPTDSGPASEFAATHAWEQVYFSLGRATGVRARVVDERTGPTSLWSESKLSILKPPSALLLRKNRVLSHHPWRARSKPRAELLFTRNETWVLRIYPPPRGRRWKGGREFTLRSRGGA
eukprot:scaffold38963_cov35-Tisochrysis_lutea.AAC.1